MIPTTDNQDGGAQLRPLPTPAELRAAQPIGGSARDFIQRSRNQVRMVLQGRDDRLLVIAGPCSIHDTEAALDYAERLQALASQHGGELLVLMRAYFEKPRTHVGWQGYLNDPHRDGCGDMAAGLRGARKLLVSLADRRLGVASELLEPLTAHYLSDVLSWVAIGARTSESQTHRNLASGLPMPVGFKNGMDGSPESALNAVRAAAAPQHHMALDAAGRVAVRHTPGNPDGHLVLRGGRSGPNHGRERVAAVRDAQRALGVHCPLVVDCSHGNSQKQPERQPLVAAEVAEQVAAGDRALVGVMLESHLVAGRQDPQPGQPLRYGQSITDACIDMEATAGCLARLASAVRARRHSHRSMRPGVAHGGALPFTAAPALAGKARARP